MAPLAFRPRSNGGGGSKRLTLLHTSDVHLANGIYDREAWNGFRGLLSLVQSHNVDAVLVAGDLFDSGRAPAEMVAEVFQAFRELGRPVVLLPGNHDSPLVESPAAREPVRGTVRLLLEAAGEAVVLPELDLTVWGKPVLDHHPGFQPLGGMPARAGTGWYVAVAHGLVMDGQTGSSRSSPITVEELRQADCDYVALGHVHVFRNVTQGRTPAFYCGAPSGLLRPTAALVAFDPSGEVEVQAVPVP